jgi:hypothetical protein
MFAKIVAFAITNPQAERNLNRPQPNTLKALRHSGAARGSLDGHIRSR